MTYESHPCTFEVHICKILTSYLAHYKHIVGEFGFYDESMQLHNQTGGAGHSLLVKDNTLVAGLV